MIEEFWNECLTCTQNCCLKKSEDTHTPVFEADIVDLRVKDLILEESPTRIRTKNGLIIEYWPAWANVWGKLSQTDGRCAACKLGDVPGTGLCMKHDTWRPIFCHVYPFLPTWSSEENGYVPIIYTACGPMNARLDTLVSRERSVLRWEILEYWKTLEPYRIAAVRLYADSLPLKVRV